MGRYIKDLASKIKESGTGSGTTLYEAEYVSPTSIKIGGEVFSHGIRINPDLLITCDFGKRAVAAGDRVLVAQEGNSFYIICKI